MNDSSDFQLLHITTLGKITTDPCSYTITLVKLRSLWIDCDKYRTLND